MREELIHILENYTEQKEREFINNNLASYIRRNVRDVVANSLPLNARERFRVYASVGQGTWAEVPWIGIFDREITESAMHVYYIVYLFSADMSAVYLSLNLGWTFFRDTFGTRMAREKITIAAAALRRMLGDRGDMDEETIHLESSGELGAGYELGHICGRKYESNAIPNDEVLVNDFLALVNLYQRLKAKVGTEFQEENIEELIEREERDLLILEDSNDNRYQRRIYEVPPANLEDKPVPRRDDQIVVGRRRPRILANARQALETSRYRCEVDRNHVTFITAANSVNYVEAHHLIPMSLQYCFKNSLDVPSNIVSLCPVCHRKLHLGMNEDKRGILEYLFNNRLPRLQASGIEITFERLLETYDSQRYLVAELEQE